MKPSPSRIPFEEFVLVALLAFVPVVFTRATPESFEVPQGALLATGALLLAWLALAGELGGIARSGPGAYLRAVPARTKAWAVRDPLGVGVLLFLASAAVSTVASPNPRQSLHGAPDSTAGLVAALSTAAVYFTSHAVSRGQATLVRYARAAGFASAVASSYALVQIAGLDPLIWERTATFEGALRIFGTLGHPNRLGGYLAMTVPLMVWLASRTKSVAERILWALVTTASAVVIAATLSRGAWLALAAAALAWLILGAWTGRRVGWNETSRPRRASRFPVAALASLLLIAASAIFFVRSSVGPQVAQRVRQIASLSAPTNRSRLYYWRAGLRMAHDHPWVGVGLDAFGTAFPRYRSVEYWDLEWGGLPNKAHNDAVQILATQGIPGGMAALLVVAFAALAMRRRLRRGDGAARAGAAPAAAALVAFVVQNLMNFSTAALGCLAAALAGWIASPAPSVTARETGRPWRDRSPATLALAGIPVAALFVTLVILPLRTQIDEKAALRQPDGSQEKAWALERAARDAPWDSRYSYFLGTSLLAQYERDPGAATGRELLRRAAHAERSAMATEPWNAYYYAALGRVQMAQAMLRPPEANAADVGAAFREAVAREPVNPRLMEQASSALSQFGAKAEARAIALRAASLYPDLGQPMAFVGYEALLDQRWKDAADTLEIAVSREWRGEKVTRAAAYNNLAAAYLELARNEEALRAAEEGLRIDPSNTQVAANRKIALERLGTVPTKRAAGG